MISTFGHQAVQIQVKCLKSQIDSAKKNADNHILGKDLLLRENLFTREPSRDQ